MEINWSDLSEIEQFEQAIQRFEEGSMEAESFNHLCRVNGIYGIRGHSDVYMVRVKLPLGVLDPQKCEILARIIETYTPHDPIHITTRQDIQIYFVKRKDIPSVLRMLAAGGMTTREACGNTIRNVTICPFAGVSASEPFDVTPYALGVAKYWLRNPHAQNLPRKFKIAFEGCREDHCVPSIHDMGIVAIAEPGSRKCGFQIYLGGGLGSHPRAAVLLEEFTPAEWLIQTSEAVIRLFDQFGDRTTRSRARFKFVVEKLGEEEVRKLVIKERENILLTGPKNFNLPEVSFSERQPVQAKSAASCEGIFTNPEFAGWKETNVTAQKQKGWYTVQIRCPLGNLDASGLRHLGVIAGKYAGGIRTTIKQNILLRWVPEEALEAVYGDLEKTGLALPGAERLIDITRCPGRDTCNVAITKTHGLAAAITEEIEKQLGPHKFKNNISIKISGCPNSCAHHSIADIGLYGSVTQLNGRMIPCYQLLLGGKAEIGKITLGHSIARFPAKAVPQAIVALIQFILEEKETEDTFGKILARVGEAKIKLLLEPYQKMAQAEEDFYCDWEETQPFQLKK